MNLLFLPKTTNETLESFGFNIQAINFSKLYDILDWKVLNELDRETRLVSGMLVSKNISLEGFLEEEKMEANTVEPSLCRQLGDQEDHTSGYNYYNMLNTCDLKFSEDGMLIIYEADNDPQRFEVRLAKTIEETYGLNRLIESKFYQEL